MITRLSKKSMISIIVPVYNEAESIGGFINFIKANTFRNDTELIIVDGGSSDSTVELCIDLGVNVQQSPKNGRASQLNYGIKQAKGEILYFLHADSYPPKSFEKDIIESLNLGFVAGCYRLAFQPNHPLLRIYGWFTRFDLNIFRFGDQSLFVRKKDIKKIGCYDDSLIVMEDQQVVRDLKKNGRFIIVPKKISTSSRKYFKVGVLKLQLVFAIIVVLYYLNVSQRTIADFYTNQIK